MLEVFGTTEDCGAEFRSNPLYVCEEIEIEVLTLASSPLNF